MAANIRKLTIFNNIFRFFSCSPQIPCKYLIFALNCLLARLLMLKKPLSIQKMIVLNRHLFYFHFHLHNPNKKSLHTDHISTLFVWVYCIFSFPSFFLFMHQVSKEDCKHQLLHQDKRKCWRLGFLYVQHPVPIVMIYQAFMQIYIAKLTLKISTSLIL